MKTRESRVTKANIRTSIKRRRSTAKVKRRARAEAPTDVGTGQSMIKQRYRECYEDGSCGDALARKLRKYLEPNDGTIDLARLQQLAERNDAGASRCASLNPGLTRVVVADRLRKLVRAGSSFDWG